MPRWNFTDFMHSFMIVFRVLCGEWIESMWDCMLVGDVSCIPFFLATVVIGNLVVSYQSAQSLSYASPLNHTKIQPPITLISPSKLLIVSLQVLNLFLALLLSNFGSSSLSAPTADNDTNKIAEAFNRISRFINWIKRSIANGLKNLKNKLTNQISIQPGEPSIFFALQSERGLPDRMGFLGAFMREEMGEEGVIAHPFEGTPRRSDSNGECSLCIPESSLLCVLCIFVYWM